MVEARPRAETAPVNRSRSGERPYDLVTLQPASFLTFSKRSSSSVLSVSNPGSSCVAFKVKTTAQKEFHVKPTTGVLKPGETVGIYIKYQPTNDGPLFNPRFLILAAAIKSTESLSSEQWAELPKAAIQELCLKAQVGPDDISDMKAKYDELLQYTLMLEKEHKKLEASIQAGDTRITGSTLERPQQLRNTDVSVRMLEQFRRADAKGTGIIAKEVLYDTLRALCPAMNVQTVDQCLGATGAERDSGIDYAKLISWLFPEEQYSGK